jgi:lysine 2,3-aminomutase
MTEDNLQAGLYYIRAHTEVKDVLLSGGDPLMLSHRQLEAILGALRGIPHVEIIRIGTRVPGAMPERVTPELVSMLSRFHPLFMNLHINHPLEITPESARAFRLLANAGIPLGSQTVLLKEINDRPEILGELFQRLLTMRVRPYYLMQMDLTQGTAHFRTPISTGLEILHALRNRISGLAIPHLVIDLPGGRGKVPLLPSTIEKVTSKYLVVRNYQGIRCDYPLLQGESEELSRWISPGTPRSLT